MTKAAIYGNGSQKDFVIDGLGVVCLTNPLRTSDVLLIQMFRKRPTNAPCVDWRTEEWCDNCGGCSR